MKTAQQWFDEYGESHQNAVNKTIHWICVPSIFFSVISLLSLIPSEGLKSWFGITSPLFNFGTLIIALGMVFYLLMSLRLAVGMLLFTFGVVYLNQLLSELLPISMLSFSLGLFVLAWIGQFIGHKIEGAKPSFFKDLLFLLVGPAWLMGFVYQRLGLRY